MSESAFIANETNTVKYGLSLTHLAHHELESVIAIIIIIIIMTTISIIYQ